MVTRLPHGESLLTDTRKNACARPNAYDREDEQAAANTVQGMPYFVAHSSLVPSSSLHHGLALPITIGSREGLEGCFTIGSDFNPSSIRLISSIDKGSTLNALAPVHRPSYTYILFTSWSSRQDGDTRLLARSMDFVQGRAIGMAARAGNIATAILGPATLSPRARARRVTSGSPTAGSTSPCSRSGRD